MIKWIYVYVRLIKTNSVTNHFVYKLMELGNVPLVMSGTVPIRMYSRQRHGVRVPEVGGVDF